MPDKGFNVTPWAGGAVVREADGDGAARDVQIRVGDGFGQVWEKEVCLDRHRLDRAAEEEQPEGAVTPVGGVEGDQERDAEPYAVRVLQLEGGVVIQVVDLPAWSGIHFWDCGTYLLVGSG